MGASKRAMGVLAVGTVVLLAVGHVHGPDARAADPPSLPASSSHSLGPASPRPEVSPPTQPAVLPGVGPRTAAAIGASSRQVVLVTGDGADSDTATVRAFARQGAGWKQLASWRGHNGTEGWSAHHHVDDLRTPDGVYGLSDAGGRKEAPDGTQLPYDHDSGFTAAGSGLSGESLAGAFDYVVAIDYNRVVGRSPLDPVRPLGYSTGGSIWLHVDHGSGSKGCVTLPRSGMTWLLRWLDPAAHPVVVMGDAAWLAR